jgi:hypothetical protein
MPAGDGTGPTGKGPGTGWGMGYCAGYDAPGWAHPGPGRGFYGRGGRGIRRGRWSGYGAGRGGGWGWRHQYYATGLPRWARWGRPPLAAYGAPYGAPYGPPSQEQEVEMLRDEAEWLREQLDAINERMDELSQE